MASRDPVPPPPDGPAEARVDLTTLHVQRARAGDADSLAWMVARFSPLLLAQARYRLGPRLAARVDPEDVVQDVWATALPRLGGLALRDGRATPVLLRFLSTTLLHRVNNLLRRAATAAAVTGPLDEEGAQPATGTAGPATRVADREAARRVLRAIDELGERDRELVVLRGIEQLDNDVVARQLDISANAASQGYRRALDRLRARLPESAFADLE